MKQKRSGTPGPKCSICVHPQVREIDAAILDPANSERKIAEQFKVNPTSVHRHKTSHLPRKLEIASYRQVAKGEDQILNLAIAQKEKRLAALEDRWKRLQTVMAERGADMTDVPGGSTGLLTRRKKQLGSGESAQIIEEYELDPVLLSEARKHEEQAARELGQWATGDAATGGRQTNIAVIITPQLPGAPAQQITGEVIECRAIEASCTGVHDDYMSVKEYRSEVGVRGQDDASRDASGDSGDTNDDGGSDAGRLTSARPPTNSRPVLLLDSAAGKKRPSPSGIPPDPSAA